MGPSSCRQSSAGRHRCQRPQSWLEPWPRSQTCYPWKSGWSVRPDKGKASFKDTEGCCVNLYFSTKEPYNPMQDSTFRYTDWREQEIIPVYYHRLEHFPRYHFLIFCPLWTPSIVSESKVCLFFTLGGKKMHLEKAGIKPGSSQGTAPTTRP